MGPEGEAVHIWARKNISMMLRSVSGIWCSAIFRIWDSTKFVIIEAPQDELGPLYSPYHGPLAWTLHLESAYAH